MSEGKKTKVEYLDEKAKSYKKDKPSRRPNASVSDCCTKEPVLSE